MNSNMPSVYFGIAFGAASHWSSLWLVMGLIQLRYCQNKLASEFVWFFSSLMLSITLLLLYIHLSVAHVSVDQNTLAYQSRG